MDERLMQTMLDVDEHHWWYRGRRQVIRAELERLALPQPAVVLDAGCGSGRTLLELEPLGRVCGIELDPGAAAVARGRGDFDVRIGRLEAAAVGGRVLRPDHLPRCDRAHARRPRDAARSCAA